MTGQPDDFEPSEIDIDMVIEEVTGKPFKPATLEDGILSMRKRIAHLQSEKTRLLDQLEKAMPEDTTALNQDLASLNRDIATARRNLAHYEALLGKEN